MLPTSGIGFIRLLFQWTLGCYSRMFGLLQGCLVVLVRLSTWSRMRTGYTMESTWISIKINILWHRLIGTKQPSPRS